MNEDVKLEDLDFNLDFGEVGGNEQPPESPSTGQQAASPGTVQQPAPAPQPPPPPPPPIGPNLARVQGELEAAKRQYQELAQRKKQLQEAGYPVPPEVDEALVRAAARIEALQFAAQEAARRDAELRVPSVLQEVLKRYPPQVGKVMEPFLREALVALAQNSPQLLNDPAVLNNVAYIALGRAQEELMRRRQSGARPIEGEPPPVSQGNKPEPMPERIASRIRVSQEAWEKVAKANPSDYLDLDW